tara:strand:- start:230 stop:1741 length:1512 start_codon:yes stop_codon:yes gene_type:complete
MSALHYDLCVIGGGINGAGIARDAAGRGLSVVLVEADDLASATSSASTKLIHGGLRYLEMYEFKMVREALKERSSLHRSAAHLIKPQEFILPHDQTQRPLWMIRLGLFLYDFLAGKKTLPSSKLVDLKTAENQLLKSEFEKGFSYFDCWADDTRLVVSNITDAASRGARILTRMKCKSLVCEDGSWRVGLKDQVRDEDIEIKANMVVNTTGPWARSFLEDIGFTENDPNIPNMRLVKGSHLIFPKLYEGGQAYILQQPDKRIVFVIPYEQDYTLIGTTEEAYEGNPRECRISKEEGSYLCKAHNRFFEKQLKPDDAIFSYSGVRPLFDDGASDARCVTRGYRIYHHERYHNPFLTVFGGKLTTYRSLSEHVMDKLMILTGRNNPAWTRQKPLVGGDFISKGQAPDAAYEAFRAAQGEKYTFLPPELLERYCRAYGTRMGYILKEAKSLDDLGVHYGDHVYEAEIQYLRYYEWAQSVEDIIWRRSKLGIHISDETIAALQQCFS